MIQCPYCGYSGDYRLIRTWKYRWWDVYFYECSKCHGKFRYQVDPIGKYKSYIIKVGFSKKSREKEKTKRR